ncbi:serine hydrolase domain-containing protein [Heyndrickxia sporothermodurans]
MAIFEEQEKLSFNHFVYDFIANLPFGKITIHQLLTHTSGIGDFFNDRFLEKRTYLNNLSDYLPLFINDKLQFEPGTHFQYSNGGYIILGLIIEKVSNLSYFDFVKKYIFKPLEMNETDSFEIDRNNHQLAIGYTHFDFDGTFQPEKKDNLSFCAKGSSAGGGFSTINDLWKFARGLYKNKLISSKQLAKITSEKENIFADEKATLGY